ncbi:pantoate--beta-alanine ligase [endosymbiont of unidentified scaly snail isolate Monju]|uniref:pantoate--beta-alanine ligase n=1 Tax=endosymbiont of unidentified scaly snail isolate Monju TaxID=1248727 RepID=UPI0003892440|nr:pantoate--beta-alanine ligase [endosymbiont of unidentified scaly snail isolate Monju]BAN69321.1 pantoate--beta-alanine ligase [endosymbiont of unidentified scaly snail isolate Monju]
MKTVERVEALREAVAGLRADGRMAFVPTMGNLHAGHLTLVREARRHADSVVVSIFVNPLQFGPNEDLDKYPRTLEADRRALEAEGVDLLFAPPVEVMYPVSLEQQTRVEVPEISALHCGASRPGHFAGVATVVCKLFNMVQPDLAVFGKKDYQQLLVIRRMVRDLAMPVEILGVDTVRESDGLAMSSRNQYLDAAERRIAPRLYATLCAAADRVAGGGRDWDRLADWIRGELDSAGFRTDYAVVVDAATLLPPTDRSDRLVILVAAWLGKARLIDNLEMEIK